MHAKLLNNVLHSARGSFLQRVAVCCSVLQRVAVCCSVEFAGTR